MFGYNERIKEVESKIDTNQIHNELKFDDLKESIHSIKTVNEYTTNEITRLWSKATDLVGSARINRLLSIAAIAVSMISVIISFVNRKKK